jgi:hypothetical protein
LRKRSSEQQRGGEPVRATYALLLVSFNNGWWPTRSENLEVPLSNGEMLPIVGMPKEINPEF